MLRPEPERQGSSLLIRARRESCTRSSSARSGHTTAAACLRRSVVELGRAQCKIGRGSFWEGFFRRPMRIGNVIDSSASGRASTFVLHWGVLGGCCSVQPVFSPPYAHVLDLDWQCIRFCYSESASALPGRKTAGLPSLAVFALSPPPVWLSRGGRALLCLLDSAAARL